MDATEVEIRERLKRAADQIQAQHRRLEPLFEKLSSSLASETSRDAQTAAFQLDGAIRAHFQLEEKIVFPMVRGLRVRNDSELDAIIEEHHSLGRELQSLIDQILESQLDLAAQHLEKFWLAIKDHEYREEAILRALDSEQPERTL
jgi:iron-sulfur cluster repair protein YtfE (RIC family)